MCRKLPPGYAIHHPTIQKAEQQVLDRWEARGYEQIEVSVKDWQEIVMEEYNKLIEKKGGK